VVAVSVKTKMVPVVAPEAEEEMTRNGLP